jgi:hypothetical protein
MALGNLGDVRAVSHLERVMGSDASSHARNQARLALQKLEALAASDAPAPVDSRDEQSKTAD